MILSCSSCGKKFVVPDQAITAAGRIVQCGSCGNKWKQFPIKDGREAQINNKKIVSKKLPIATRSTKTKKKGVRKTREINLYSPEYLAKKHGIKLNDSPIKSSQRNTNDVSFGFYNSFLLFIVIIIVFSKGLHFFQDYIIQTLPISEFYLNYFFESIKNMFEIWKNLISSY